MPEGRRGTNSWQDGGMRDDSLGTTTPSRRRVDATTVRFIGALILAIGVFAGFLVALGVRLDHQSVAAPTPSASEKARQDIAVAALRIENSAKALASAHPEVTSYADIVTAAGLYAESVGGVWVPWPSGAPSGHTNPPLATTAPSEIDAAKLTTELTNLSDTALAASGKAPEEDRGTYTAIALSARLYAQNLAAEVGAESPACPAGDPLTAGAATPDVTTLRAADTARQWFEVEAAQLPEDQRSTDLTRIDAVANFEEAIIAAGATDKRGVFAPIPSTAEESLSFQALSLLTHQILVAAAITDQPGREALVGFSCSLFATPAERSSVLPILTEPPVR